MQGGHYTRPDLIRLLVDKRPKSYIVHADREFDGGSQTFQSVSTLSRVGLDKPLPEDVKERANGGKTVNGKGEHIDGVIV